MNRDRFFSASTTAINKQIIKLTVPNIVSNITVPLLGMVDLAMMGRLNSPVFIGAVALGTVIFNMLYLSLGFLRMGTTGFTAQASGAGDKHEISYTLYRAMTIAMLIALSFILLQKPIEWIAYQLLDGDKEVKLLALKYFRIRILAAPATLALYVLMGWFIGMQNTLIPMIISIAVNVLNIGFNILFVLGFHMQVEGVAWGTLLAQYGGVFIGLVFLLVKYRSVLIKPALKLILQKAPMRKFLSINTDILIRSILLLVALSFFTSKSAIFGNDVLAINAIFLQLFFFFSYFMDGFAYAGEAMAGNLFGAKQATGLQKLTWLLFGWGIAVSLVFSLIYLFFGHWLVGLLTDIDSVSAQAYHYYFWMVFIPLSTFAAFIWDGIYVGVTAAKAMRNTMIIAVLGVFFPAYFVFTGFLDNHGIWLAFHLFMLARGISMTFFARKAIFRPLLVQ